VGNASDALDIVQDAMLKLVTHYRTRAPAEWAPLFYRVLENRIQDHRRRRTLSERLFTYWGWSEDSDPLDNYPAPLSETPEAQLGITQDSAALRRALKRLLLRQQQVVLLREWEGLDVRQTARAMGCTQGSVKTHYARAMAALRAALGGPR